MVNLGGFLAPQRKSDTRSEEEQREDAGSSHAGTSETSLILFLRPDLVSSAYKNAQPLPAPNRETQVTLAKTNDWPGYWGSPRLATAAAGAARWKVSSSRWAELALKILDGFDYKGMKRLGDEIPPPAEASISGKTFTRHNQEIETKEQEWLKKKGLE